MFGKTKKTGFTLLEFALVMMAAGIVLATVLQGYTVYLKDKHLNDTYNKQSTIDSTISSFYSTEGRYPCPSNPTLDLTDVDAGVEDCTLNDPTIPIGTCQNGICKVGGRDTEFDTDLDPDPVLIGGVPYKTMKQGIEDTTCLSSLTQMVVLCTDPNAYNPNESTLKNVNMQDVIDPWGYQMTYAVTGVLTAAANFQSAYGAINVVTEGGVPLVQPEGSAHFVVVSHGENHLGAYNGQGRMSIPCGATMDSENCNGDALFISGLLSLAQGPDYFDDILLQRAYAISLLWQFSGANNEYIYNVNPGNVGIGTDTPEQKLDVAGTIGASNGQSGRICDTQGLSCWDPELLGGPADASNDCDIQAPPPAGKYRVITGIKNGQVTCSDLKDIPYDFRGKSCANAGEFVRGITPEGDLICGPP